MLRSGARPYQGYQRAPELGEAISRANWSTIYIGVHVSFEYALEFAHDIVVVGKIAGDRQVKQAVSGHKEARMLNVCDVSEKEVDATR